MSSPTEMTARQAFFIPAKAYKDKESPPANGSVVFQDVPSASSTVNVKLSPPPSTKNIQSKLFISFAFLMAQVNLATSLTSLYFLVRNNTSFPIALAILGSQYLATPIPFPQSIFDYGLTQVPQSSKGLWFFILSRGAGRIEPSTVLAPYLEAAKYRRDAFTISNPPPSPVHKILFIQSITMVKNDIIDQNFNSNQFSVALELALMIKISEATEAFGANFGYVMIIGSLIALEVTIFARIFGGMPRKVFSPAFMKENFGEIHKKAFGQEIGSGGHPDAGSGFYSQKLGYKEWVQFNNSQRVHLHFVEWIATYLFLLVCAGAYFPITAASIGLGIFLVRIWYALGYVIQGPKGRVIPFIVNVILTIGLGIISILSGVQHIVK